MNTDPKNKPVVSIGTSYVVGAVQLFFFITSLFHDGPGDQNVMMFWYAILFIPSLIIISIASGKIQSAVKNNIVSRMEGYAGLYMFALPLVIIFIFIPLWQIVINYI